MSNINEKAERGSVISTILEVLKDGEKYGYEIIKEVEQKTGVVLKQPSLYSCLTRLEGQGIITSYWKDSDIGGRRHYYRLAQSKNNTLDINELQPISSDADINKSEIKPNIESEDINFDRFETISNSIKIVKEQPKNDPLDNFEDTDETEEEPENTSSRLVSISNILLVETQANNNEIAYIENEIISAESNPGIPQQISMIDTKAENQSTKYENILGDILYEKKDKDAPIKDKQTESSQQFFIFDNDEIKVENDKNFLNNVLLKTAKTDTVKSEQVKKRKQILHFTKIDDLKKQFNDENIVVAEYSYLNYETTNKKRYISAGFLSLFLFLKLLIFAVLSLGAFKYDIIIPQIKSSIIIFLCISLIEFIVAYLFLFNKQMQKKFFMYNIGLVIIVSVFEVLSTVLFAFSSGYSALIKSFNITYFTLLFPIIINFLSILFSKKASKF